MNKHHYAGALGALLASCLALPGAAFQAQPGQPNPAPHPGHPHPGHMDMRAAMPSPTMVPARGLTQAELDYMRGVGLRERQISAIAVIAAETGQPPLLIARQVIFGGNVQTAAVTYGLDPRRVMARARGIGRVTAGMPMAMRAAGARQELVGASEVFRVMTPQDLAYFRDIGLTNRQIAGAAYISYRTGQPVQSVARWIIRGEDLRATAAVYNMEAAEVTAAARQLAPQLDGTMR